MEERKKILELCENVVPYQMYIPRIEIYRCEKPEGCREVVPFSDFYVCGKAYNLLERIAEKENNFSD